MISRLILFCSRRSLSSLPKNDPIRSRISKFIFAEEKENFDEDFVRRAYKWDQISREEWELIYRDLGASRSFLLVSTLVPISVVGALLLIVDRVLNEPSERSSFSKRIDRDIKELGILSYFPGVAVVLVFLLMLRVHRIRLLRIYQNRKNVDTFIAVRSNFVVQQHKMEFDRSQSAAFYFNEDREIQKLALNFLFGNIQIGDQKFLVNDESFLGNNYRSYMLNETSFAPRLVQQSPKK